MNLQPLGDRLIVEVLDEEELTVSGIVLPDTAREKPQRGRVLAVGPGGRDEDGKYIEMDVAEGDENVFENQGAQLVREVATSTNDVAGDGTTTATLLAQAIVREGLKNVAAGANPMALKRGIEQAVDAVVENLKTQSKEVSGKEDIARVATISAREREIGDVIADAIEKVGKDDIENTRSEFDGEKLQERLAKRGGGGAVVKVGAATETEMKEKKHRVEDALQATRAALEEGIVPGGGVALLNAAESIKLDGFGDPDERTGAQIIVRALEEPLRQLAYNAGLEGSGVVNNVRTAAKGQGLNVNTNEVEDLVKAGIIDPTMVTRPALQDAASIAKNILMTEAIVAEPPEEAGAGS